MDWNTILTLLCAALPFVMAIATMIASKYTRMKVTYYEADLSIIVNSKYHDLPVATIYEANGRTMLAVSGFPSVYCKEGDGFPGLDRILNSFTYKGRRPCELRIIMRCTTRDRIIHAAKTQKAQEIYRM